MAERLPWLAPGRALTWALALAAAWGLAACQRAEPIVKFGGPTMGSTYQISYVAESGTPGMVAAQAAVQAVLREVDDAVSTYRPDSALARFNAAPAGTCMAMPEAALALARHAQALHQASGGAFDVTLLPALNAWGFGPQARATGSLAPSDAELAALRQRVGQPHLRVQGTQLCKDAPVQVDFNSIAAGYAVDRIAQQLQAQGVRHYLIDVTGEMRAAGRKPDGAPWRIGIEAPLDGVRQAQKIIALNAQSVSTSGDYRNWREVDGQRVSHVLDARSLRPVTHALAAVTVVAPSALQADGLSTLLMVLGPQHGFDYAQQHRIAALFVSRVGTGFATRATPAFDTLFPASGDAS
ncbi:MAG: FAD:protein FMN transferase [Pseudomonadota bacterium]|nr:FAD:protein FMN transferase [Pseudomonadota bacterium]